MLPSGRLLRSARRALALILPSSADQWANKTIEDVNADRVDLIDVVLTRALEIPPEVAPIRGARGRNVDPDLYDVEQDQLEAGLLDFSKEGENWDYGSSVSREQRSEIFRRANYEPFAREQTTNYMRQPMPKPSSDQGFEAHPTFGRLGINHPFWSHRLREPGVKILPGSWENLPCEETPYDIALRTIAEEDEALEIEVASGQGPILPTASEPSSSSKRQFHNKMRAQSSFAKRTFAEAQDEEELPRIVAPGPSTRRNLSRTASPLPSYAEHENDTAPVDWSSIEGIGLTLESVYRDLPNTDSLPTAPSDPSSPFFLRTTSTGWAGGRAAVHEVVALLWAWMYFALGPILAGFKRIPFRTVGQNWTVIKDRMGRIIAVRSPLLHWISGFSANTFKEGLTSNPFRPSPFMQQVINEVVRFVRTCTDCERGINVRGPHWFHISGHDRQIKDTPDLRAWGKLNTGPLSWLMRPNSPFFRLTNYANGMVRTFFPGIFRRYMRCIDYMGRTYKISPLYGLFWQFCINWGEERLLVDCWPHVDAANLAIGVCVIFIFGWFPSDEVCWLVIWEANIMIELPAGVFLAYPSSLFYHFNINIEDVEVDLCRARLVVAKKGVRPTPQNSEPLTKRNSRPGAWRDGHIRGSCVWFNQASMYQTSELGVPTMAQAHAQGMDVNVDLEDLMERGELF